MSGGAAVERVAAGDGSPRPAPPVSAAPRPRRPTLREPDRRRAVDSAFENAPVGMAVLTPAGSVTLCNRAMAGLLGRDPDDLTGRAFFDVVHLDDVAVARRAYEALQAGDARTAHHEWRFVCHDGAVVWVSVNAAKVPATVGRPAHLLVHVEDVTARKALEATLVHRALHDALTGLPNRVLLAERIGRAYAGRGRHARPNCLFYIDLNGFKTVNDRFGHATGDRVLQLLADRFVALLRPEDTAARLGGDEFAVLCVDVEPRHCAQVADRLRAAAAEPFLVDGRTITISAAVGGGAVHTSGPVGPDPVGRLQQADRPMYDQKHPSGRGGAPTSHAPTRSP